MDLQDAIESAKELRALYAELETNTHGRAWTVEEIMLGFVGDVGDLAKLVQASAGIRAIPNWREGVAHELADCLWSVLVLADRLEIDIERAFADTMTELKSWVRRRIDV